MRKKTSEEQRYLAELISDFGVIPKISPELAVHRIQSRYSVLIQSIDLTKDLFSLALEHNHFAPEFPKALHKLLYSGILNNAGMFRSVDEPYEGEVLFGPRQQFRGTHPSRIEEDLRAVFKLLGTEDDHPVHSIAKFYQRFVQVHPFYDANGRIGRVIVSLYLDNNGLFINWKKLEANTKWIKRLNNCHKRHGKFGYAVYLNRHVDYWRRFIKPKSSVYTDFE